MLEIEAKYFVDNPKVFTEILKLKKIGRFSLRKKYRVEIKDEYYDTNDLLIARNHGAFRIRNHGGSWRIAFKTLPLGANTGIVAGVQTLEEFEIDINPRDLKKAQSFTLDIEPIQQLKKRHPGKHFYSLVTIENHGWVMEFSKGNGTASVELDDVVYTGKQGTHAEQELEIESLGLPRQDFDEIVAYFVKRFKLKPVPFGKYGRALRAVA